MIARPVEPPGPSVSKSSAKLPAVAKSLTACGEWRLATARRLSVAADSSWFTGPETAAQLVDKTRQT
ncbi:hypothetical protein GCM10009827_115660 [Dactylosporangium maewongense]|uniref:DUF4113 domain-containing protein n=1 Tax=Dactylosporangium maewongense TaxID=634393 RepID=A0ABN2DC86_9ACTN